MNAMEADARILLLGVLAEIEGFSQLPMVALQSTTNPFIVAMCNEGVPFLPAVWSGKQLSVSRRMSFSRAAHRLAGLGHVHRITEGGRNRVRCLVPTKSGLLLALEDAGNQVDRAAVCEGLDRTIWGRPLVPVVKR